MNINQEKYNIKMRIMHWLVGILILLMLASGYFMVDLNPKEHPIKWEIYGIHKSIGTILIFLIALRIVIRLKSILPSEVETFPKILMTVASINHKILYLFMVIMPLSGYLMSALSGYNVAVFGFEMPIFLSKNNDLADLFHQIHETAPYIMLFFLILHVGAVLKHWFIDKKNILKRII